MIINSYRFGVAYDTDAQTFIDAGSFTTAEEGYINQLVLDLKTGITNGSNVWSSLISAWPFIGGDASNHALDLKRANDLTFINSPTHASTGVTFNGTTQYAQTGITPSADTNLNDVTLGGYLKNNVEASEAILGVTSTATARLLLIPRRATNTIQFDCHDGTTGQGRFWQTNTDSSGLIVASRRTSTDVEAYRQGSSIASESTGGGTRPTTELYLAANRNTAGNPANFLTNEMRFALVADGLTDNENKDLYDAIQAFQTSLSRNV